MKKKMNGGIEGIIALVILVGIVIALIIAVVLPIARGGEALGEAGTTRMSDLKDKISGDN